MTAHWLDKLREGIKAEMAATPKGGPDPAATGPGPDRQPHNGDATTAANDHNTRPMRPAKLPEPTPARVKAARLKAKLTQAQAGELVHLGGGNPKAAAIRWSEHEAGRTPMDTARWELFLLKTGQIRLKVCREI